MNGSDKTDATVPPPLIYLGCLAIGLAADCFVPLPLLPQALQYWIGLPIVALSLVLFGYCSGEIISTGPFRYSRNPVYVSMTLFVVGVAIAVDSLWALLMAAPAVLITHRFVVLREEAFLANKFGDAYRSYQANVRRWI